jgi:hypothetical protein
MVVTCYLKLYRSLLLPICWLLTWHGPHILVTWLHLKTAKTASSTTGALVGAGSLWPETFILLNAISGNYLLPAVFCSSDFSNRNGHQCVSKILGQSLCCQHSRCIWAFPIFGAIADLLNWSTEASILYLLIFVAMAFCHYLASTDFPSFLKLQIHLVNWFM